MKKRLLILSLAGIFLTANAASSQIVVVNDPTAGRSQEDFRPNPPDVALFEKALAAVKKKILTDMCEPQLEIAGVAHGAFSKAGVKQTLIFYQYCQTGNGLGWNGLVLTENGKVIGNFVSEGGWGVDIAAVPDINQNGLAEFTLAYSGGLHQGHGGIGVDLMEFAGGLPKGIGWYKAEEFGPTEAVNSWKLTAKPGKTPVFYKQKYFSGEGKKARPVGRNAVTKLGVVFVSKFESVK